MCVCVSQRVSADLSKCVCDPAPTHDCTCLLSQHFGEQNNSVVNVGAEKRITMSRATSTVAAAAAGELGVAAGRVIYI